MNGLNMIKRLDKEGRIVIPKDIRRILDIEKEFQTDEKIIIEFYVNDNNEVVIKKYESEEK